MKRSVPLGISLIITFASIPPARAAGGPFNYSPRIRYYTGGDTAVRGDTNTVGMGGATIAIPMSISAALENPAGFAMTTGSLSAQINKNTIDDNHLQKSQDAYDSNQWGLAVSPQNWGFGILYDSPKTEGGNYISPVTGHNLPTEVSVKEFHAILAHSFFDSRFSIGVSAEIERAIRNLAGYSYGGDSFGMQVGVLYRLKDHVMIGGSFRPQTRIDAASDSDQNELPGFNQPILCPAEIGLGVAWIPNRFFKTGFGLHYMASTPNTALLADQNVPIGQYAVLEPRLGASYVIGEFNHFKIEYAAGTYFEPSRIVGTNGRIHATMGLEVNPYFINTGVGFDAAAGYKNLMVSIGIDIVRTLRTFQIIPKDPVPPVNRFLPGPTQISPDGLPHGLTTDDPKGIAPPSVSDVRKIIEDIPKNISNQFGPAPTPSGAEDSIKVKRKLHRKKKKMVPVTESDSAST